MNQVLVRVMPIKAYTWRLGLKKYNFHIMSCSGASTYVNINMFQFNNYGNANYSGSFHHLYSTSFYVFIVKPWPKTLRSQTKRGLGLTLKS